MNSFIVKIDLSAPGTLTTLEAHVRSVLMRRTGLASALITVVLTVLSRRLAALMGRLLAASSVKVSFALKLPDGYQGTCASVASTVDTSGIMSDLNNLLQGGGTANLATLVSTEKPVVSAGCSALSVAQSGPVASASSVSATNSLGLYAGAGGGGVGLILLAVAAGIIIVRHRRKMRLQQQEKDFQPTWSNMLTLPSGREVEVKWRAVDANGNTATKFSEMVTQEPVNINDIGTLIGFARTASMSSASPRSITSGSLEEQAEVVIDLDNIPIVSPRSPPDGGMNLEPYSGSPRGGSPLGSPRRSLSPRAASRGSSRERGRHKSRSPRATPQAYYVHEFIEYFSLSYQRWTLGWIYDGDGRNDTTILYKAIVGPKLDQRRLVPLDIIRRPLLKDEPIYVQGGPTMWFPATIVRGCPIQIDRRRYSVKVQWSGKVIHKVPGIHIKRRHPVGSTVYVFLNPVVGWRKGVVLREEGGPIPVVRPKYFDEKLMPSWTMVTVFMEQPTQQIVKVPSYTVDRKDLTVGPKPFLPSQLTDGLIPPVPYNEEDYGDDDDDPGPFDLAASVEQVRQLLQACLTPQQPQQGLEIVVLDTPPAQPQPEETALGI